MEIVAWVVLVLGLVCGPLGAFVPVVPGSLLPVAGALIHKLILPQYISWWTIAALAAIAILERVVDFVGTLVGAKWAGATRWGLFGAVIGGIAGLFPPFFPWGLLVGPMIGAFVAEIVFARRGMADSARAGAGAGVGYGISLAARLALALLMIAIVIANLLWWTTPSQMP